MTEAATESVVTITIGEYKQLLRDSRELQALNNAGVDNWSGRDYAMDELREEGFFDDED